MRCKNSSCFLYEFVSAVVPCCRIYEFEVVDVKESNAERTVMFLSVFDYAGKFFIKTFALKQSCLRIPVLRNAYAYILDFAVCYVGYRAYAQIFLCLSER